jgi:hypothetical protein
LSSIGRAPPRAARPLAGRALGARAALIFDNRDPAREQRQEDAGHEMVDLAAADLDAAQGSGAAASTR